jgi:hypothetical protein
MKKNNCQFKARVKFSQKLADSLRSDFFDTRGPMKKLSTRFDVSDFFIGPLDGN